MNRKRKKAPPDPVIVDIESLSHEGRGITRVDGKIFFVDGALPGETVNARYNSQRSSFDEGVAQDVIKSSMYRVEPECDYFGVCGGCALQHVHPEYQLKHKQHVLMEQLSHIGNVEPDEILAPITTVPWGYRRKARLGVKYVYKKAKVLVGFREKGKSYIADIDDCKILHPAIGDRIADLKALVERLSIKDKIPQIELAVGDNRTVIVIRHLAEFNQADRELLLDFSHRYEIDIYLQAGNPDSIQALKTDDDDLLLYQLTGFDIDIEFGPLDFTQINFGINELMIEHVIGLMQPGIEDTVLDLFCGLGNFTLPIATLAGYVIGVEGSASLVARAKQNAVRNRSENVDFICRDLYTAEINTRITNRHVNKLLLDPPRSGAREILEQMDLCEVVRIVYVSCNPATLARDAGILQTQHGFKLKKAGVIDMFPHTTHVESIALFERD